jgi:hypothetical protein
MALPFHVAATLLTALGSSCLLPSVEAIGIASTGVSSSLPLKIVRLRRRFSGSRPPEK